MVVLSGAGLSAASGVPTFRGAGGLWRGHRATDLATPQAFAANPQLVRDFYDMRRAALEGVEPNPGHRALVRLQAAWGPGRVVLVTQNVDGLLQAAADREGLPLHVFEMHGSIRRVRCHRDIAHPQPELNGPQDPAVRCATCGGPLRPAVVWFGEVPLHMEAIGRALARCSLFVSVGTSGVVYPAAGFVDVARRAGARCVEINPEPSPGVFDAQIPQGAEVALPRLVDAWLG
jgi:NAD-dependent deacetylase